MSEPLRTALVVEIPEADAAVGGLRAELDPFATLGVPAHVTILFPFAPAPVVSGLLAEVQQALDAAAAFTCEFVTTRWFDDRVVWLAPADPAPFLDLTARMAAAFPAYPPDGGMFAEVVPHLTVGVDAPLAALQEAERTVVTHLPVRSRVSAVSLLVEQPDRRWRRASTFRLTEPGSTERSHRAGPGPETRVHS
ncbi:MAG: hypothetical protein JWP61_2090 [Friedmanniella sp.]|nr:hypothetical protein [Friedmanniella sp.]